MQNENNNIGFDSESKLQSVPDETNTNNSVMPETEDSAEIPENNKGANEQHETDRESVSSADYKDTESEKEPSEGEPTVRFDTVEKTALQNTNTGIKVFFALISVIVMLIIAVSVGYIFGKKTEDTSQNYLPPNTFETKGDSTELSSYSEVFDKTKSSVVCITVYNDSQGAKGYASGVIYTSDGYIITNDHIYSGIVSPKFLVRLSDGTEYKAKFIAGDTRSDLAVLKIDAKGLTAVSFGSYDEVVVGEEVVAIGYQSGAGEDAILTVGTVSSTCIRVTTTSLYSTKMLQTDTPINPGSSGGALVNMYSQVIGITSAKLVGSVYDSVGYAIPSSTVVKIVDSLIKNGYVEGRGKLGITYTVIDAISAESLNLPRGLLVSDITEDSDLSGKNISKNDIITHINDIEITRSNIALDIIESTLPGQSMSFTVYHPSTKTTETIYASLIPDQGSSSYSNEIVPETDNPLNSGDSDFYSDH